jgi:hypothetical protein
MRIFLTRSLRQLQLRAALHPSDSLLTFSGTFNSLKLQSITLDSPNLTANTTSNFNVLSSVAEFLPQIKRVYTNMLQFSTVTSNKEIILLRTQPPLVEEIALNEEDEVGSIHNLVLDTRPR